MNKLERATRQLGGAFGEKPNEIYPGRNGTGFMFWNDCDHCIYADFYGPYEREDKVKIASALTTLHEELHLPYSLRIGFHETEKVAIKTMMEWFGTEEQESEKNNQTSG